MPKYRIRFGIRLSWPITNAATFVFYVTPQVKDKLSDAVSLLRLALAGVPGDIAGRVVFDAEPRG